MLRTRKALTATLATASAALVGTALAAPAEALPVARFVMDRPTPRINRVVTFDASRSLCDVPPCGYAWRWYRPTTPTDFDRLGTSMGTGVVLQYSWSVPGTKIVVLTVTNATTTHGKSALAKQVVVRP